MGALISSINLNACLLLHWYSFMNIKKPIAYPHSSFLNYFELSFTAEESIRLIVSDNLKEQESIIM